MSLKDEIKRKLFHHLALAYVLLYAATPRWASIWVLGAALAALGLAEFIRLRRPEINDWFLRKFEGLYRPSEILAASGIFWTLAGCWLTILVFTNKKIVMAALGILVFGDTAAALVGKSWGKHPWPKNPAKTWEGSAAFAVTAAAWSVFFVRAPVAVVGACVAAWVEARPARWNDNFWIPLLSGATISMVNLVLGR